MCLKWKLTKSSEEQEGKKNIETNTQKKNSRIIKNVRVIELWISLRESRSRAQQHERVCCCVPGEPRPECLLDSFRLKGSIETFEKFYEQTQSSEQREKIVDNGEKIFFQLFKRKNWFLSSCKN